MAIKRLWNRQRHSLDVRHREGSARSRRSFGVQWAAMSDLVSAHSRDATNFLLDHLRRGGWRLKAWSEFLVMASERSFHQALAHPRALLELTALHLLMGLGAGPRGRRWIALAWLLAATHLGLLEDRKTLGAANIITLARGNLPALEGRLGQAVPVLALLSDFVDGKLARATATVTLFGEHADFMVDTAFWTWFSIRHEPSRTVQVATFAVWLAPVAAVGAAAFARGEMIDVPRSRWFRPAATVQVLLGIRMLQRFVRQQKQENSRFYCGRAWRTLSMEISSFPLAKATASAMFR